MVGSKRMKSALIHPYANGLILDCSIDLAFSQRLSSSQVFFGFGNHISGFSTPKKNYRHTSFF